MHINRRLPLSLTLLFVAMSCLAAQEPVPVPVPQSAKGNSTSAGGDAVSVNQTNTPQLLSDKLAAILDTNLIQATKSTMRTDGSNAVLPNENLSDNGTSVDGATRAIEEKAALKPTDTLALRKQMDLLCTKLQQIVNGNGQDLKTLLVTEQTQAMARTATRVDQAMKTPEDAPFNWHEISIAAGYGLVGRAEVRPRQPEKLPEYAFYGETKRYGDAITKSVNDKMDEAENKLEKIFGGKPPKGCSAFDFASEFVALFNAETLKNFVKNMKDGIIAAAPMAILQALSPELANLIQNLKAMAAFALNIANGNCETAKAALTPALEKMFNGPQFNQCVDNLQKSGYSLEMAKRGCTDSSMAEKIPGLGWLAGGINDAGRNVNDFLAGSAAVVNGGSYDDTIKQRDQLTMGSTKAGEAFDKAYTLDNQTKDVRDAMADYNQAKAAMLESAAYQSLGTPELKKAAQDALFNQIKADNATAFADLNITTVDQADGKLAAAAKTGNQAMAFVAQQGAVARSIQSGTCMQTNSCDQAMAAMGASFGSGFVPAPPNEGIVQQEARLRALKNTPEGALAVLATQESNYTTAYKAWIDGGRSGAAPNRKDYIIPSPPPSGATQTDLKDMAGRQRTLDAFGQLRNLDDNSLMSGTSSWYGRLAAGVGDFAVNYVGSVVSMPRFGVGLQVGDYSYSWSLEKIKHHGMDLSWDLKDGLSVIWKKVMTCDPTVKEDIAGVQAMLYGLMQSPWRPGSTSPAYKLLTDSGVAWKTLPLINTKFSGHAGCKIDSSTIIKLSYVAYCYKYGIDINIGGPEPETAASTDADLMNESHNRGYALAMAFPGDGSVPEVGYVQALTALGKGAVATFILEQLAAPEVQTQIQDIKTKIDQATTGNINDAAQLKAQMDEVMAKNLTAPINQLNDAMAAIIAINGSQFNLQVDCGSTGAPLGVPGNVQASDIEQSLDNSLIAP